MGLGHRLADGLSGLWENSRVDFWPYPGCLTADDPPGPCTPFPNCPARTAIDWSAVPPFRFFLVLLSFALVYEIAHLATTDVERPSLFPG